MGSKTDPTVDFDDSDERNYSVFRIPNATLDLFDYWFSAQDGNQSLGMEIETRRLGRFSGTYMLGDLGGRWNGEDASVYVMQNRANSIFVWVDESGSAVSAWVRKFFEVKPEPKGKAEAVKATLIESLRGGHPGRKAHRDAVNRLREGQEKEANYAQWAKDYEEETGTNPDETATGGAELYRKRVWEKRNIDRTKPG